MPPEEKEHIILWVDDYLLRDCSVENLLKDIHLFLAFNAKHNSNLQPAKLVLYTTSGKWCGQIITADGIHNEPSELGLINMDYPTTSEKLQNCICAMH